MDYIFEKFTDQGRVRTVNEDYLGILCSIKIGDVFVVCDGMGGHVGGEKASKLAVECILNVLSNASTENIEKSLIDAITFANNSLIKFSENHPEYKGMGSTVVLALISDDILYLAHMGDSRAYVFSDEKLFRMTKDDSYVQLLIDKKEITEEEAENHPFKNRISKALGVNQSMVPTIYQEKIKLKKGDKILLCSDGLTSLVSDFQIEKNISNSDLLNSIINLHNLAMNNGGYDNITIILIEVLESKFLKTEFKEYNNFKRNQLNNKITNSTVDLNVFEIENGSNTVDILNIEKKYTSTKFRAKKKNKTFYLSIILIILLILCTVFIFYILHTNNNKVSKESILKIFTENNCEKVNMFKCKHSKVMGTLSKDILIKYNIDNSFDLY